MSHIYQIFYLKKKVKQKIKIRNKIDKGIQEKKKQFRCGKLNIQKNTHREKRNQHSSAHNLELAIITKLLQMFHSLFCQRFLK